MSCTVSRRKPPSSAGNRNPPKPYGSPARWNGPPSRRNRAEPLPLPRRQERHAAPTELTGDRGTDGSNPSPSSKESATNLTGKIEPALARNRRFESVSLRHLPTQKENLAGGVAGDAPHVTAKFRAQHSASVPGYRSGPPSFPDGLRRNGSVRVYRLSPAGFSEHGHIQCQRLAALHLHGLAPSPRASVCRPRGLCRIKKCLRLD